jgi:malate dehydrogenase (oxaloacetate-decarboxylating)(NADP+)
MAKDPKPQDQRDEKAERLKKDALEYHLREPKGKLAVHATKPCTTQRDLSLAYSPGVAAPCLEIAENLNDVFKYTNRGNLVAVISNGSAVLGLGDIGPEASKPVMEGKGVLFKRFADIDVFDVELKAKSAQEIIDACIKLEPTFGGINLEDIKSPECFEVEETLREKLNIPVFHDDQHGTAIIAGAALLNALEITKRDIKKTKMMINGAGASAIACAKLFMDLGIERENLVVCDSKGVIFEGRTEGMNPYKERVANKSTKDRTLLEAMKDADVFVGLSVKGAVSKEMVSVMAKDPIIMAMANPDPEITPEEVAEVRDDAIMATGRSDYPNQVNNVLGFPFIFRGALDVRAKGINEEMKRAAVHALADLAKQDVPEYVARAYDKDQFKFGRDYLIPKPFDHRVLLWVAPAVAKAASETGMAREPIDDIKAYTKRLESLLGSAHILMQGIKGRVINWASKNKNSIPRLVFPEGTNEKILKAADMLQSEGLCQPILLGKSEDVKEMISSLELKHLDDAHVIHPSRYEKFDDYAMELSKLRQRKGMTFSVASQKLRLPNYFAPMMVKMGDADAVINGQEQSYPEVIRPMIQILGAKPGFLLAGIYMMVFQSRVIFFADTTVNIQPNASELADIAILTADMAERFLGVEARVAMLSFSNFGSNDHPEAKKVKKATELVWERKPNLICEGEIQADVATQPENIEKNFPYSHTKLKEPANVMVFPDLNAANITYKLMSRLGGAEAIGPILVGLNQPSSVLQRGSEVMDIVNMASITALEVIEEKEKRKGER